MKDNKNKRNIIIAIIFLIFLFVMPFWTLIQAFLGMGKTKTTLEDVTPKSEISCTMSVSCQAVLDDPKTLKAEVRDLIPTDGWLFPETTMTVSEGISVLEVLRETALAVETDGVPPYVVGIGGLYAGDAGEMSGWTYSVNGETPMVGCDEQKVKDGDKILWTYVTTWDTAS